MIADDSLLVREGIASLLRLASVEVAAASGSADELLHDVDAHQPDIAIIDVRMPPTYSEEGLHAALRIRVRHPLIGLVILSQYVEVGVATRVLAEHPARLGYLLKDRVTDVAEFVATLRRVADGGSALDPQVVSLLLAATGDHGPLRELTARERDVLRLVAEGLSNQAIAERLGVARGTTEKSVSRIFTKLDLPDSGGEYRRVLAVRRFLGI